MTGAGALLKATHRSREGIVHEHEWEVRVWTRAYTDATVLRYCLTQWLERYEGKHLPDNLAWAEDLATAILLAAHGGHSSDFAVPLCRVEILRHAERLYAVAER